MKTNLITAVKLFDAIVKLSEAPMDYSSAHALVMTKAELEPHITFFAEKESDLLLAYTQKDEEGNPVMEGEGRYVIHKDDAAAFRKEREQLNSVEVEIKKRKLKKLPETITPAILEVLMLAFELPDESEVNGTDGG